MTDKDKALSIVDTMKLALEALESCDSDYDWDGDGDERQVDVYDRDKVNKAITAIKEALAQPEQRSNEHLEPVALRTMRMWITALKSVSSNGQHMKIPSGLSSGTCWELAVELERFINTPPQRDSSATPLTWVGLTDEEIDQGLLRTNYAMQTAKAWRDGVRWAYHQLKDKNT